jgi:hypothetical protein
MPYAPLTKFVGLIALVATAGCSSPDLSARPVMPRAPFDATPAPYSRREWRHWIDADHDCQDTRQEVLIAESEVPVEFADDRHCKVKRGRWTCPYTGRIVTDPAELDIDHLVPLENANASGGWRWSRAKKQAFANDLEHPEALVAVVASANRQKGSKAPDAWLPPRQSFVCSYLRQWIDVKSRWRLSMTTAERLEARRMTAECRR